MSTIKKRNAFAEINLLTNTVTAHGQKLPRPKMNVPQSSWADPFNLIPGAPPSWENRGWFQEQDEYPTLTSGQVHDTPVWQAPDMVAKTVTLLWAVRTMTQTEQDAANAEHFAAAGRGNVQAMYRRKATALERNGKAGEAALLLIRKGVV